LNFVIGISVKGGIGYFHRCWCRDAVYSSLKSNSPLEHHLEFFLEQGESRFLSCRRLLGIGSIALTDLPYAKPRSSNGRPPEPRVFAAWPPRPLVLSGGRPSRSSGRTHS